MKRVLASVIAVGIIVLPIAAQERADKVPKEGAKPAAKPPRATYQHKTDRGHLGNFELNGEKGKADYYFNGQHHQDDLVYTRTAEIRMPNSPNAIGGWAYQVSRGGKKESLWFFFAAEPLGKGGNRYAMFYSTTPPNQEGKQPWTRILTPGGTQRTSLDTKPKGGDEDR